MVMRSRVRWRQAVFMMGHMSPPNPDEIARRAAITFATDMTGFWERRLGGALLGVYLLGSLAHDGFSRRYSDIDMLVLAEEGVGPEDQDAMREEAKRIAPDLAGKLSLFWSNRACAFGRFPPLDRLDYIDRPLPLIERERVACPRPSLPEIRAYLAGAPFANWVERSHRFMEMPALPTAERKPFIRQLLYPARLVYSWTTGDITSNDAAVAFLAEHAPRGLDRDLVERALALRQAAADPDPLFAERGKLARLIAACEGMIAES